MNVQNAEFTAATGFFVAMCACTCIEQPVTISKAAPTKRKLTIVDIILQSHAQHICMQVQRCDDGHGQQLIHWLKR